jgi:adenosylcobinamide-GDP ribazoletransferase
MLRAVAFLTRIPVPGVGGGGLEAGAVWFPLVGALLGALLALADLGLRQVGVASLFASVLVVALLLALSGALHADGLMDTCDAVFAHASPERRLEIMRDPRVGSFGVAGFVAVVLIKVAAVDALPGQTRWLGLVTAPVLGRWAILLAAFLFPAARPTGSGARLKTAVSARALAVATLVPLVACAALWPAGPIIGLAVTGLVWQLGRWLTRLLGGLTGDCYGALCEVAEALAWLLIAPLGRPFSPA